MERNNRSILVKFIRSLRWIIVLAVCFAVFVAGAGKLMEWMVRQSVGVREEEKTPDIEEEFALQAEEIGQWMAREKGLAEGVLEIQCQGLTASFSYGGETLVMTGYPVESGIKETEHLQDAGEREGASEEGTDADADEAAAAEKNQEGAAENNAGEAEEKNQERAAEDNAGEAVENPLLAPNGLWDYGKLWEYCGNIFGESGGREWSHDTYPLLADPGEQAVVLLYQTSEGEDGCLFLTDTMALRLSMGKEEKEAGRLDEAKAYLEAIANRQKFVKGIKPPEKVAEQWDSLWTGAFRKLCEGRIPYEDIGWADEKVREEVVWEIKGTQKHALVSREEVMGLEALRITGAEDVECFRDFRYMQNLHTLSVSYWEPEQADVSKLLEELPVLSGLTGLEIRNGSLSDLSFAEKFSGLEELVLDGGEIRDVSPLDACTELKKLQLPGGEICDISPLGSLKKLEYLVLNDNEIRSLEGLETLENLTVLDISHNQVEDLSPLAGMKQMEELYAGDNGIADITPLKELEKLRCLSLSGNQIEDIRVLAELKEMVYLWAENNRIDDYVPLEGLDRLYFLSMSHDSGQDVGNLAMIPYLVLVPQTSGTEAWEGLAETGAEEGEQKLKPIETSGTGSVPDKSGEPGADLKLAQRWLNMLYPAWELEAKDIVKGDMNGDGINDMAIIGIFPEEKPEDGYTAGGTWYIYMIMSKGGINNGLWLMEPIPVGGSREDEVDLGYFGAALSNGRLMVQYGEYSGSNPVRKTDIYEYDGRRMVKKMGQTLQFGCFFEDSIWRVEDPETGTIQSYSISDGEKGERRQLSGAETE